MLLTSPGDPTGAVFGRGALREVCAGVPEEAIVVVDEALGEFAPDGEDAAALVAELPNLLVVRSFSKAHAMAGLRAGAALGPAELVAPLAPSGGMSAPAQAAAGWAVSERGAEIAARRRATAASAARAARGRARGVAGGRGALGTPLRVAVLERRGRSGARGAPRGGAGLRRARAACGATSATCAPRCAGRRRSTGSRRRWWGDAAPGSAPANVNGGIEGKGSGAGGERFAR